MAGGPILFSTLPKGDKKEGEEEEKEEKEKEEKATEVKEHHQRTI